MVWKGLTVTRQMDGTSWDGEQIAYGRGVVVPVVNPTTPLPVPDPDVRRTLDPGKTRPKQSSKVLRSIDGHGVHGPED
jgi:hypothetical protein